MTTRLAFFLVLLSVLCTTTFSLFATDAEMYFSYDKNGETRVTHVQEGDEIWIVVMDNDENDDCDVRDKMWPDLKIMDPKTGAYIVWQAHEGDLGTDYLEETNADSGIFVSKRAFQLGTRESFALGEPWKHTHVVDVPIEGIVDDFQFGHWIYASEGEPPVPYADERVWLYYEEELIWDLGPEVGDLADVPSNQWEFNNFDYIIGRFENMDTLIGMYQDPNDASDVAVALMKIIDTEAAISWDRQIYKDADTTATITVVDPDENLNCNEVEYVPVYIIVNPGSWVPVVQTDSPTTFCGLLRTGGVAPDGLLVGRYWPIRWYNIYDSFWNGTGSLYYIRYDVDQFDTIDPDGITPVLFYAQETGADTGIFQLNLNSILEDLGFNQLLVRDVLVAFYLDPNDFDDFKLATAYIEEKQHSTTTFMDANRTEQDLYWIGRDPVYIQVVDANANTDSCCPEQVVVQVCDVHGDDDSEFFILDETSSNSPVFLTLSGIQLWPVWDALGVGLPDTIGGFQLQLDNWKLEVFNEDDVYARYNDVQYESGNNGLAGLGDTDFFTAFPPAIQRVRVPNDVSFGLMSIADTQVYDGVSANMWFLDRQGNRVSGYVSSDCVFVEVLDPDQDEDSYRRERIEGYWDEAQNIPFGPFADAGWLCGPDGEGEHYINDLLGHTTIFNEDFTPKLYVLNPRNGYWASVDLLETGISTGDFVSVICIDLADVYECVPTLGTLPGDTIVAFYQDPSNHSDSAMISIKVGIGGGGSPLAEQSETAFVDVAGTAVEEYFDTDAVFVKVFDRSQIGSTTLSGALDINGTSYNLIAQGTGGEFIAGPLDIALVAGQTLTATYIDPANPLDTSSDSIGIVSHALAIDRFLASPSPFEIDVTFSYVGSGIASTMTVDIYDLAGHLIRELVGIDVTELIWDGTKGAKCAPLANGAYLYVVTASDGTSKFRDTGLVFLKR